MLLRVLLRARIRHIHDTSGGTTTVYVTHDQEEATALADRSIVMNHARIQQIGTFDDVPMPHMADEFYVPQRQPFGGYAGVSASDIGMPGSTIQ